MVSLVDLTSTVLNEDEGLTTLALKLRRVPGRRDQKSSSSGVCPGRFNREVPSDTLRRSNGISGILGHVFSVSGEEAMMIEGPGKQNGTGSTRPGRPLRELPTLGTNENSVRVRVITAIGIFPEDGHRISSAVFLLASYVSYRHG